MGGFLSFVKKETLHILRDPRTMFIALLVPIVQTLLFGFAISVETENIDFAAVAPNRTEAIRGQVERLSSNPYFTFKGYIDGGEINDVLRRSDVDAVAVFADDYDRQIMAAANGGASEKPYRLFSTPRIPIRRSPEPDICRASYWRTSVPEPPCRTPICCITRR